jgi:hypothetical protein
MAYTRNRDENFIGFNPVNWWGIVEDRNDPLESGRLRVRIFGWHNLDKNLAPKELLPWAQLQLAPNVPRTFAGPKVNEWVTGYFIDGAGGQFPVINGVMPGINLELLPTPEGAPKPPPGVVLETADTPSIPPLARGVVANSIIAKTNADVVHVCDISLQVRQVVGWIRVKFGTIINEIRAGIDAIIRALGFDRTGQVSAAVSFLKKIASYIKLITDILEEVLNWREVIFEVARIARAIVDWILNLPEKLLKLLRECLGNLYRAIAGGFQEILSIGLGSLGVDTREINAAINEITTGSELLIRQATDLASTPAQLVGILTGPSDPTKVAAVEEYILSQTTDTDQYSNNNFDKSKTQTV